MLSSHMHGKSMSSWTDSGAKLALDTSCGNVFGFNVVLTGGKVSC